MTRFLSLLGLLFSLGSATPALAISIPMPDNTHLIEASVSGFAIYRTSKPNRSKDFKRLCAAGVREMMVLDGTGSIDAAMAKKYCPGMKVIYDVNQSAKVAVDNQFLAFFDRWVLQAKATGKRIAFRCNCGCHRTGRLAAYYRMKYQGMTSEQAIAEMMDLGRVMIFYPQLPPQVRAMKDYIDGRVCGEKAKYCVIQKPITPVLR